MAEPNRDEHGRFAEPLYQSFQLYTNGRVPCIDRLAIICRLFDEMEHDNERRAALGWLNSKHGKET